ncbi:MAG: cytochrome c biogenesis protein CcsA [Bacteroidales bacterium]|nr:cytochrome c biogenesis protein CcsA [Bacteroidales bacterium]
MKNLRHIVSVLMILLIIVLATGTVVEKLHGSDFALSHVYAAWWFVALWAMLAIGMMVMLFRNKAYKRPVVCILHGSILLILLGALLTMLAGKHGEMTLKPGVASNEYQIERHGQVSHGELPFTLTLDRFEVETYPGTRSPMDFVSHVTIGDAAGKAEQDELISMNNILKHRGYRFYQSDYDEEGNSVLSVAHDPWGIGVTYTGYALLFIGLVGMFFERKGQFRQLLRNTAGKMAVMLIFLTFGLGSAASASPKPRTIPKESADQMGKMYVMYKGRVCPLQTLAKDFTTKLCGKARYRGYSPEQVLGGWLFYYDDWRNEPMFKEKNLPEDAPKREKMKAEERTQIINMLTNGKLLKLFPHADSTNNITWYSQSDELPLDIPDDEYLFIRKQLSLCQEYVVKGDFAALDEVFVKTRIYQEQHASEVLPGTGRVNAERLYNRLSAGRWLAMATITLGLVCFALALVCLGKGKKLYKPIHLIALAWVACLGAFLALLFILRWIAGGHVPMAGSFDSMNLLALSLCIITLLLSRKYEMALPAGLLMTGMVLLVQMMGGSNPPVTHLMPVLSSPLLSLHVTVIMIAYALLFFILLNGISAVIVRFSQPSNIAYLERLQRISTLLLYPAVALLAMGIFIGAIWANISWGNYWSWDPKEVWALITLLVYSAPLHSSLWKSFSKPMFFHVYGIVAFLSVVITYFGVNLILGGVHAYS